MKNFDELEERVKKIIEEKVEEKKKKEGVFENFYNNLNNFKMETKEYFEPKIEVALHSKELIRLIKTYPVPLVNSTDTAQKASAFPLFTVPGAEIYSFEWESEKFLLKVDIQMLYAIYLHLKHIHDN